AARMEAGRAVERVAHEAGIVGDGGQAGGKRCGFRLDARIGGEARAGFLRLGQAQFARRNDFDAMAPQKLAHFNELALVVGGDDDTPGNPPAHAGHITASFCRSISLAIPLRAKATRARSCSSLNATFSAVACTSTMLPSPDMMKFASVSASESSA